MSHRVRIIVTPGSGEGRATATARRLRKVLTKRGHQTSVQTYTTLSALERWAKTCEADFTHLVCIGGDATQSAAARAAMRLSIPFVPVPNGFGNMFARAFGHPDRVEHVAELLDAGELRRVDIGIANDRELFLSHRSYGPLQQIQQTVENGGGQPKSRLARHLAYYGMAKRFLVDARLPSIRVEVDGKVVARDASVVTVANVETYRGFLSLTPTASPIDGLFDVFIAPRTSRLRLHLRLLRLLLETRGRWNGLVLRRGRHVVVTVNEGRREDLRTLRRALPLLVPRGSAEILAQRTRDADAPLDEGAAKVS
ncbi:MAG TPA: diacylglycerol kinase family protein [Methylomirabilota bacterium]